MAGATVCGAAVGYGQCTMCGRYVSASSPQQIADYFGATSVSESLVESDSADAPFSEDDDPAAVAEPASPGYEDTGYAAANNSF